MDVSVVVPVYNGAQSVGPLTEGVAAVLAERRVTFQIILVNDGSTDGSWAEIQRVEAASDHVLGIDLLSNHGQHRATICGLAHSRGDVVITMDDDLQHPPAEIAVLLDALDEHRSWDAVIGRWGHDQGFIRDLGSRFYGAVDRLAHGTPRGFRHSGFRALRRPVVDAVVGHDTRTPVLGPMIFGSASEVHNVWVQHAPRVHGRSGFRYSGGARIVFANLIRGSTLPLRLLSGIGFASASASLLVGALYFVRWIVGSDTPPGWLSAFLATLLFGGLTVLGIGILGGYVAHIIQEVGRSPRWSIRQTVGDLDDR